MRENQGKKYTVYYIRGGPLFGPSKISESRDAYACRVLFGPPEFLSEINYHVIEFQFWSTINLFDISILVHFEQISL